MGQVFYLIYGPATPFVGHPERAYIVAALLAALCLVSLVYSRPPNPIAALMLVTAAVAWGGFGYLEALAVASGANIRIDLLVTWPLLCLLSAGAIAAGYVAFCSPAEKDNAPHAR
jgi:hypothetical protein